ncbi:hypothetical protein QTJ16_005286 [Diplocarpon rosae]|uniref:RanBP2-type domain-containing protein n=1 Tax=Diplocarpon rosae TaxID=946125 RepID=A0AAD9WB38_9HELO|nr:hypothetical protein QTJ16_005286 [Diplocarpon rosae]
MTPGDSGLQQSIWAGSGAASASLNARAANWKCPSCGFSNYKWRANCFRCLFTAGFVLSPCLVVPQPAHAPQRSTYVAPYTKLLQTQEGTISATAGVRNGRNGLSVSIWAPRNADKRENPRGHRKVWTRTISQPALTPSPKSSDFGLPYQVQHHILVMIERMLEESCFEFALRWIPDILHAKSWDCAEAVELSTWKSFLPTFLPSEAIRPRSNHTLEAALGDAVRIRNSAVHRHLCDNDEIRKMALQAQDLMFMFEDGTRQDKFHRLWLELKEWDVASAVDAQAARAKLESAIQEISERPVDDMDWTPNATSLQEMPIGMNEGQEEAEYSVDAMELD